MTVGLFGTGRLGTREAQLFKAMGCRVLAYNPHPREAAKPYVEYVTKETVLREAELIVLQCALNEENRHMINTETIAQMRDGVYLVNTARGGLMNFADVLDGLKSGKIAGLATDVYDHEETFVRKNCAGMEPGRSCDGGAHGNGKCDPDAPYRLFHRDCHSGHHPYLSGKPPGICKDRRLLQRGVPGQTELTGRGFGRKIKMRR